LDASTSSIGISKKLEPILPILFSSWNTEMAYSRGGSDSKTKIDFLSLIGATIIFNLYPQILEMLLPYYIVPRRPSASFNPGARTGIS
jgi:hypothetical protein